MRVSDFCVWLSLHTSSERQSAAHNNRPFCETIANFELNSPEQTNRDCIDHLGTRLFAVEIPTIECKQYESKIYLQRLATEDFEGTDGFGVS